MPTEEKKLSVNDVKSIVTAIEDKGMKRVEKYQGTSKARPQLSTPEYIKQAYFLEESDDKLKPINLSPIQPAAQPARKQTSRRSRRNPQAQLHKCSPVHDMEPQLTPSLRRKFSFAVSDNNYHLVKECLDDDNPRRSQLNNKKGSKKAAKKKQRNSRSRANAKEERLLKESNIIPVDAKVKALMQCAAKCGSCDIAGLLLDDLMQKSFVDDFPDKYKDELFNMAVQGGSIDIITLFLEKLPQLDIDVIIRGFLSEINTTDDVNYNKIYEIIIDHILKQVGDGEKHKVREKMLTGAEEVRRPGLLVRLLFKDDCEVDPELIECDLLIMLCISIELVGDNNDSSSDQYREIKQEKVLAERGIDDIKTLLVSKLDMSRSFWSSSVYALRLFICLFIFGSDDQVEKFVQKYMASLKDPSPDEKEGEELLYASLLSSSLPYGEEDLGDRTIGFLKKVQEVWLFVVKEITKRKVYKPTFYPKMVKDLSLFVKGGIKRGQHLQETTLFYYLLTHEG